MTLAFVYTIAVVSSIFWIFPAIRNYKTRLSLYFLIQALTDPIVLTAGFLAIMPGLSVSIYTLFAFLLVASLRNSFESRKLYFGILAALFLLGLTSVFSPIKIRYLSIMVDHICIAFIFIGILLSHVATTSKIKGYHIILLFYELSLMLKILFLILTIDLELGFFYTTTIFEMLIAVFFSFYKETDEKLLIDLKNV